jgi:hypothetical protein
MTVIIVIAVLLLSLWTWICYLITKFVAVIISKLTNPTLTINKISVFVVSLFVSGLSTYFIFFSTPSKNYKTAYIEKQQTSFKVTVKGKRVLMAHDPVTALLRQTYDDSLSFLIPRQDGIIQSSEIKLSQDRYKPTGSIFIDKEKMYIKLYYDTKKSDPDSWNGEYNLQFR